MSAVADDAVPASAGSVDGASGPALTVGIVLTALATQLRVLNALMLRDTKTRYGTHRIGFLWALIEPALSVSVFVGIFSMLRQDQPGGMPLVLFLLVGFMSFGLCRDPWGQMQSTINGSRQLLTFPQVTTFDVLLARGLLEIAVTLFVFALLLFLCFLFGHDVDVERPLGVLAALGLIAMLGLGAGFLFGTIEPLVPSARQFSSQVIGRPLYFASGLFFTLDSLPPAAVEYLLWNPLLHMIELVRSEFFASYETAHGSWLYASGWSVGSLSAGLLVHQALRNRAIVAR